MRHRHEDVHVAGASSRVTQVVPHMLHTAWWLYIGISHSILGCLIQMRGLKCCIFQELSESVLRFQTGVFAREL